MKATNQKFLRTGVSGIALLVLFTFFSASPPAPTDNVTLPVVVTSVYEKLNLQQLGLSTHAYTTAVTGWQKLKAKGAVSNNEIGRAHV